MRNLLITLLLLLTPLGAAAQIVDIPDRNLRAILNQALGKPAHAAITQTEMATLTRVVSENSDVSDLTGLEFATNLQTITLRNGSIQDLSPISELHRLGSIHFDENLIQDISPIAELSNLEWIWIQHNLISDISPVASLPNLIGLGIGHNLITDFSPISRLPRLERIWMSENPPADVSSFSNLTRLQTFHSWGTPILGLDAFRELPKLSSLDICGGDLRDLSALEGMTQLQELYLVGNNITDITPLASLTNLRRLDIHNNGIVDVSPLAELDKLAWVDLHNNEILDFTPLAALPGTVNIVTRDNPGSLPTPKRLSGSWLWMIAPTGNRLGAGALSSGIDFLRTASGGSVTELSIARNGAQVGDAVGSRVWTESRLYNSGNNINDMVNDIGLGFGDVNHHVAYGLLTLDSRQEQNTRLFVGSGDAIKVWLNGQVVHSNPINRDATTYTENFAISLKEGTNLLLVAIYEGTGWWSGFFGIDSTANITVIPPDTPSTPAQQSRSADVNEDSIVNIQDLVIVSRWIGATKLIVPRADVNSDGVVNIQDILMVARNFDAVPGAPAVAENTSALIRTLLVEARAADDGSLAFRDGIANLEKLLAALVPKETRLLANYPNPFNPETWIPYHLSTDTEVNVTIYAPTGEVVRKLALGHQTAGRYTDRTRAAYWDGRNDAGEQVASGIYFYELRTEKTSLLRKMVILK